MASSPSPEEEESRTFTYTPKDGGDPIVFPHVDVLWEEVDGLKPVKFLWRVRKLNETYQMFAFFDRARVDDEMVERALDLPLDERREMLRKWFAQTEGSPEEGALPPES